MKANEIIIRQDRVVYMLMLLVASLGLVWSFWQHRHNTAIPGLATQAKAATLPRVAASASSTQAR